MGIKLELPKLTELKPRIIVVGVGGAGGNAVNNMISSGLAGVEFVVANTDAQALVTSSAEHRVQLGVNLTEGLGAGSKPEVGESAAEEAIDELRAQVAGAHMVFVACGMGGGTGTGAASVIARVAREQGILTVGVVTKPFLFEGTRRMRSAEDGIEKLQKYVDTLIVIPNQNLFRVASEKTTFAEAFIRADQVLYSGIACIVDLIVKEGLINLDFADVRVIMSGMGSAMMGTGEGEGERRATIAAQAAITNPLLDELTLSGAKGLLLSIVGGRDLTLYEVDEAASLIRKEVDPDANIIVGASFDETLGDRVRVSIVASGMDGVNLSNSADAYPVARDAALSEASDHADTSNTSLEDDADGQSGFVPAEPHTVLAGSGSAGAGGLSDETALEPALETSLDNSKLNGMGLDEAGLDEKRQGEAGQDATLTAATNAAGTPATKGSSTAWQAPGEVEIEEVAPQLTPSASTPQASTPVPQSPAGAFPPAQPFAAQHQPATASGQGPMGARQAHPRTTPPQMPSQFAPEAPKPVTASGVRMPQVEDFPLVGQRDYRAKTQPPALPGGGTAQPPQPGSSANPAEPRKKGFFERLTGRRPPSGNTSQSATHPQSSPQGYKQRPQGSQGTSNQHQTGGQLPKNPRGRHEETVSSKGEGTAGEVDLPVFFDRGRR